MGELRVDRGYGVAFRPWEGCELFVSPSAVVGHLMGLRSFMEELLGCLERSFKVIQGEL